jgi:hypothetical protein
MLLGFTPILAGCAFHHELQDLAFARTEPAQRSSFRLVLHCCVIARREAAASQTGNDSGDRY